MIKLKKLLKEATKEKFGLKYNDKDHYVVHDSLRDMNDGVNTRLGVVFFLL